MKGDTEQYARTSLAFASLHHFLIALVRTAVTPVTGNKNDAKYVSINLKSQIYLFFDKVLVLKILLNNGLCF